MAKNASSKFVRPDADLRQAEAAKTSRLRLLRLAKEAEDAEKAGWAMMPGTDKSNSAVATACADKLGRI